MSPNYKWKKAIVMGGGISGLISAHVLSEYFENVMIYEKGKIERDNMDPRKHVPQGKHIHILLTAAVKSLHERFPQLFSTLQEVGSTKYQVTEGVKWLHHRNWKSQFQTEYDFTTYAQTRPVLETQIRNQVLKEENIQFLEGQKIIGYVYDNAENEIMGIEIENGKEEKEVIQADIIIDATGRSSKTIEYFENNGIKTPDIDKVDINIKYVSTFLPDKNGKVAKYPLQAVYPNPPETSKFGVIGNIEGDRVIVTLMGVDGNHPPTNWEGFLDFASQLDDPYIYEKIKDLKPLTKLRSYGYPRMRRIYFNEMEQLPANFIAIGDAICHFDPIFGQGMTVATLEADILDDLLENTSTTELSELNQSYFNKVNNLITDVWNIVLSEDSRFDIDYKPNLFQKMYRTYMNQIYKLHDDEYVVERFYKVINLEKRPYHLFNLKILWKIVKENIRRIFR